MKYTVKKWIATSIGVWILFALGCTDHVGDAEINLKTGSATSVADVETAEGMLKDAMYRIHDSGEHQYQYQFNLHVDNYAGYLCVGNALQGRLPSTYFRNPDFEAGPKSSMLLLTRGVVPVMNSADTLGVPELGAIASIMFNFAASECVDAYGPLPYFAYRNLQEDPPVVYDKVSVVYKTILSELEKAQKLLADVSQEVLSDPVRSERLKRLDKICQGNLDNWRLFANSLRMRLAMRLVKVEPEFARTEFENAYYDGVLGNANDPNIELDLGGGRHPLYVISVLWYDSRLNASLETIMKRYDHPLLEYWFTKVAPGFKNKENVVVVQTDNVFAGIRSGTSVPHKENRMDTYLQYSALNSLAFGSRNIAIFKASEALFLCAEAKLRGWNIGATTAQDYYQRAIRRAFTDEGKAESDANDYMKLEAPLDITYHDLYDSANDYDQNMVQVGVRWLATLTQEEHLEQIITQKYIANFPLGMEAWSEFRRTGYPRLIPVVYDAGDNSVPTGDHIRRMPFPKGGSVKMDDITNSAIPALREEDSSGYGMDVQGARLWWDRKDKGNF